MITTDPYPSTLYNNTQIQQDSEWWTASTVLSRSMKLIEMALEVATADAPSGADADQQTGIDLASLFEPQHGYEMIYPFLCPPGWDESAKPTETTQEARFAAVLSYYAAREIVSRTNETLVEMFAAGIDATVVDRETAERFIMHEAVFRVDHCSNPERILYAESESEIGLSVTTQGMRTLTATEVRDDSHRRLRPTEMDEKSISVSVYDDLADAVERYADTDTDTMTGTATGTATGMTTHSYTDAETTESISLSELPVEYARYPADVSSYFTWPAIMIGDSLGPETPETTVYSGRHWSCHQLERWVSGLALVAVSIGCSNARRSDFAPGWFSRRDPADRIDIAVKMSEIGVTGDPPYAVLAAIGEIYELEFAQTDDGNKILTWDARQQAESIFADISDSYTGSCSEQL